MTAAPALKPIPYSRVLDLYDLLDLSRHDALRKDCLQPPSFPSDIEKMHAEIRRTSTILFALYRGKRLDDHRTHPAYDRCISAENQIREEQNEHLKALMERETL